MEGNQAIREFLKSTRQSNRVSHAYLFLGEEGTGKKEVALWYEQLLNGGLSRLRANLLFVEPEEGKREITLEQIQHVTKWVRLTSGDKYRVVVFHPAEAMNMIAQNALLKTLEEPSSRAVLILLANGFQGLVETILSRCQILKFHPVDDHKAKLWLEKEGLSSQQIQQILFLSQGKIEKIKFWRDHLGLIDEELLSFQKIQDLFDGGLVRQLGWVEKMKDYSNLNQILSTALQIYHYFLLQKAGKKINGHISSLKEKTYSWENLFSLLKNIQQTKTFCQETYVNKKLALNQLFINL